MGERLGFWTLGRFRSGRKKNPVRNIFTPFSEDDCRRPTSTSVPSLVVQDLDCSDNFSDDNGSVQTVPGALDGCSVSLKASGSHQALPSIPGFDRRESVSNESGKRRKSLLKVFTSKRGSKSAFNLASKSDTSLVDNENLNSSTLAVPEVLEEEISKEKQMIIGRKKFNIDPKRGIEYLVENKLLSHSSKDVAQFLFSGEGLNKSQIGNYLGEFREFNLKVLQDFINLQDFTGLGVLQALRQFLWTFHPPGEAQKIERMLEGFSDRYCLLNPTAFDESKGCFTLAFCIVILNTLLHNVNVKEKPPFKVFVDMVNMDQDLPESLLEEIFEAIKAEPFRKDDGDDLMHTFFNPDREGWLWKQGGRYKSWKRRWFIMTGKCLYYFEYTTDKEFRGIIPLENIKVREVQDRRMTNCFEIFSDSSEIVKACKTSNGKVIEGRHRVYRISATSKNEKQQWMDAIRKSTMFNPLYKLLESAK